MAAEDYLVHRHHSPTFKRDELDVWKPIAGHRPVIQIDQANKVTASIEYGPEDAQVIAQAILDAAGLNATITIQ
jgi:hypothetical protein